MNQNHIIMEFNKKCQKIITSLVDDLNKLNPNLANPSIFASTKINYFNNQVPLRQIARIEVKEAKIILITPFDHKNKNLIGEITAHIKKIHLGLEIVNCGKFVKIVIPQLTHEKRKDFVKVLKSKIEHYKVEIRNLRRLEIKKIKSKDQNFGEDKIAGLKNLLQEAMDEKIKIIQKYEKQKEKELLTI